jgi:hypothetical protein
MGDVLTKDKDISCNLWTTGLSREFSHYSFNIYKIDYANPFIDSEIETEYRSLEQAGLEALDFYDKPE